MLRKCIVCKTPKESKLYGRIWLSEDGYCSVCNVKYGDRPKTKSIFEFKLRDVENKHLDTTGIVPSKKRQYIANSPKKAIIAKYEFEQLEKKKNPTLEKWIKCEGDSE